MSESTTGVDRLVTALPDVDIDAEGVYKYILIKVKDDTRGDDGVRWLVRGHGWAGYHNDILEHHRSAIVTAAGGRGSVTVTCQGGGRIAVAAGKPRSLRVYGYSVAYGRPDAAIVTSLLRGAGYEVDFSEEGY